MSLRKWIKIIPLLAVIGLLTACSSDGNREVPEGAVFLEYGEKDPITCFTVDEGGVTYICSSNRESEGLRNQITRYDKEGNPIGQWQDTRECMSTSIKTVAVYKDKVLFCAKNEKNENCIYELDPATGTNTLLHVIPDFTDVKKLCITEKSIFLLGVNKTVEWEAVEQLPGYGGSKLFRMDRESGELIDWLQEPGLALSDTPEGNIMLYAYDKEEGYCFVTIDGQTGEVKERIAKQIADIFTFAYDGEGILFYSPNALRTSLPLMLSYSLLEGEGIADMMPNTTAVDPGGIVYRNGFTYVWNGMTGTVQRLKNAVYIKENPEIRVIASSIYGTPSFSAGYVTKVSEKTDEELTLAVLSNDSNFDVFYMSSRQSIAGNLRENGVYYGLNEVPNVKEYIGKCFPYIQEAATDEEGNIWMIPLDVSIPVVVYDREKCRELGADFEKADNLVDLLSCVEKCSSSDAYDFSFNASALIQSNLRKFLRENQSFDTPEFRQLAAELKRSYLLPEGKRNLGLDDMLGTGNISFSSQDDIYVQTYDSRMLAEETYACGLAAFHGEQEAAICTYICVNPASDNLEASLSYIGDLCGYLLTLKQYGMFQEKAGYPDTAYADSLYEIYSRGCIDFGIPQEIYLPGLQHYMESELAIDEMIREADRQLEIYRKE